MGNVRKIPDLITEGRVRNFAHICSAVGRWMKSISELAIGKQLGYSKPKAFTSIFQ